MKKIFYLYSKSLLSKLALIAILIVGGGNSAWAERTVTISGTSTTQSSYPFCGLWVNKGATGSQYIIPKDQLTKVQGETISKIKLYFNTTNKTWGDATFKVYLKEVNYTAFSSNAFIDWTTLQEVYSGALSIDANGEMTVTFSTPFSYSNDNLLIGFNLQTTGTTNSLSCYGESSTSNISIYTYTGSGGTTYTPSRSNFLPKTTIFFTGTAEPTSLSVSDITYDGATLSWSAGESETTWQVYYSTTEGEPNGSEELTMVNTTPSLALSGLSSQTTYYTYVRSYISESDQSVWVNTSFTTLEQYPLPTAFTLSNYTPTTATFVWTNGEGTTPTSWQIRYSTSSSFNPENGEGTLIDNITSNPYTLEGLAEETTYYVSLRAYYGSSNYSAWTNKVAVTPSDIQNTLLNEGTAINYHVPLHNNTHFGDVMSQFIIPSSDITSIQDRQITKLTFYANSSSINWTGATFDIYLKETSNSNFSSANFENWGTNVYSGSVSVLNGMMIIDLITPFNYHSGNLLVGFKQGSVKTASSVSSTWYGVDRGANVCIYHYISGTTPYTYRNGVIPKITITTQSITADPVQMGLNGYTTFASPRALDLAKLPSGLKAYKASTIDGTRVRFTEIDDVVAANTGILLEGNASETYNIPVATTSGNDISGSNLFFVNSTGGTFTAESGYTYYGMIKATSASDAIVFGRFDPSSVAIPTNRAYLKIANASGSRLTCVFDNGETTGVQTVTAEPLTVNQYFDLQGRRVAQPTRGFYIVNGRKVVIK